MLDLEPGVHLEKVELAAGREQELDRSGAAVARGPRRGRRGIADAAPQRRRHGDRGGFFDQLLMTALDAALALA